MVKRVSPTALKYRLETNYPSLPDWQDGEYTEGKGKERRIYRNFGVNKRKAELALAKETASINEGNAWIREKRKTDKTLKESIKPARLDTYYKKQKTNKDKKKTTTKKGGRK